MLLDDPDLLAVLRNPYRVRSSTVQEFAKLDSLPGDRLDAILLALQAGGYVLRDGDHLTPVSPDAAVASAIKRSVKDQRASLAASTVLLAVARK
jgi:hypothetical protein